MRRQRAPTPIITLPKFMKPRARMLKHCSIINWRIRKNKPSYEEAIARCKDENVNQLYFVGI